jgi:hypothetical protein
VTLPPATYRELEPELDLFSDALVTLENLVPDLSTLPEGGSELPPPASAFQTMYFCIPPNDKLLGYWDTVADRLTKIRNGMNIDGVAALPTLFSPPIDPGLLVRAAALGLDLSSVVAGLGAPAPFYRFHVLSQKATELLEEVRTLGTTLLTALERRDAEQLQLLRSTLELQLLGSIRETSSRRGSCADRCAARLDQDRAGPQGVLCKSRRDQYR